MIKKSTAILALFSAVLFSASLVLADDNDSTPDATHSTMVSISEGGALVLYGHTLTKYDSDLEVVKVVDVRKSAKPRTGPISEGDMMMHPHRDWNNSSSDSDTDTPRVMSIPKLSEDKPDISAPVVAEPSSDIQAGSTN